MKTLNQGRSVQAAAEEMATIRATVEGILTDITQRGDRAVRELSIKFDNWDRKDYRLTDEETRDCLGQQALEDIKFAQTQVRGHGEQANFRVRRYGGRNVPHASAVEAKVGR